jgi:hypothetical protein
MSTNTALKLVDPDDAAAIAAQAHEDVQTRAAARAAELSQLHDGVVKARVAADQAAEEYRANLSLVDDESAMRLRQRMEVLRDRADFAEAQARTLSDEIAPLLREASRDRQRAELTATRAKLSEPLTPHQDRIRARLVRFRAELQEDLAALYRAVGTANELRRKAEHIASSIGEPEKFGAASIDEVIAEAVAKIQNGENELTRVLVSNATGSAANEQFRVEVVGLVHGGHS